MLLYLSLLGLLLSLLLLYFNGRRYKSSIYLSVFFFLVSLYTFYHHIFVYEKSAFWIAVLYVNLASVFYLTGPMAYFYVRSVLKDDARLRWKDCWHFLPAIIHFSAAFHYVITPWSHKMGIAEQIVANVEFMAEHNVNYFAKWLGLQVVFISRPLIAVLYTVYILFLFIRHQRKHAAGRYLAKQQKIMNRWIWLFIIFQFMLFMSFLLFLIARWPGSTALQFLKVTDLEFVTAFALIGLLLTPFLFPQVLYGLPDFERRGAALPAIPEKNEQPGEEKEEIETTDGSRPSGLQLEQSYLDKIGDAIDTCMHQQQPFLEPEFNLLKLSHLINIPAHHLSFYFREVREQPFNDYRNGLRVEYAKELISSGRAAELTLEAIGQQSGFVSKSSFFKAFKKVTGDTPGRYTGTVDKGDTIV
ncbi:MAG: helix-turn-helix domain-containing protein [Pseudobacter sp.]|uniref:helix-turn-helix domain-containing protein n=1 Tax=Pseudobacter sp. TaxID=2045420 RepID=UPI003F80E74B